MFPVNETPGDHESDSPIAFTRLKTNEMSFIMMIRVEEHEITDITETPAVCVTD